MVGRIKTPRIKWRPQEKFVEIEVDRLTLVDEPCNAQFSTDHLALWDIPLVPRDDDADDMDSLPVFEGCGMEACRIPMTEESESEPLDAEVCAAVEDNDDEWCGKYIDRLPANESCDCYNFCNGQLIGCYELGEAQDEVSCDAFPRLGCTAEQGTSGSTTTSSADRIIVSLVCFACAVLGLFLQH